jgi:hypothetical protein
MKYFNSLPLITTTDNSGNSYLLRNLLVRTELIPQLAKNSLVMYQYEVREGDTPEIIANKYYGDSYRYWMVLYGNPNMMDPQGDWPKSSQQFNLYLTDKYAEAANTAEQTVLAYTQTTPHHYEKIMTTVDDTSKTTAIKNIWVDFDTYNSIVPSTTTNTFADGSSVTLSISSKMVNIYDYENDLNESKRNINLINSNYINQMESQYQALVGS